MIFLGVAVQYTQKIDMSIGIVCMINHTAHGLPKTSNNERFLRYEIPDNKTDSCFFQPKNGSTVSLNYFC